MKMCRLCSRAATQGIFCERHAKRPEYTGWMRKLPKRKRKPKASQNYPLLGDSRWQELSRVYRANNPFCVACQGLGKHTMATVTDHIIPARLDRDRWYDETNLQALCFRCHNKKTGHESKGMYYDFIRQVCYTRQNSEAR